MPKYFLVQKGESVSVDPQYGYETFSAAKEQAEIQKKLFRRNVDVIKVETVYTTQTLEELAPFYEPTLRVVMKEKDHD